MSFSVVDHLFIFSFLFFIVDSLKCFSCASVEYQSLFERNSALAGSVMVPKFDQFCDSESGVQQFSPVESCRSACVTVFEPHYIGGLQLPYRPFVYIRGCADRVFAAMETRPAEVDVLHQDEICVSLKMSLIYPQVTANEIVQVCSCVNNACNHRTQPSPDSSSSTNSISFFILFLFIFLVKF
ncbi:unnamed protein product, partial [Mesorhabditis belari]|uniref:Uncharacterized protein n=1 Tax=Mesorhabditis belari TaxID=2138241 RepID=A0AAF3F1J6_9BILA